MNLDRISKLCNMVDNTYWIIASYIDTDGNPVHVSCWLTKEHEKLYCEQAVIMLEYCMKTGISKSALTTFP